MQQREFTCDGCGGWATDLHELIPRSHVFRHSEARELIYSEELVSVLCPTCHSKLHDSNPKFQLELWKAQFKRYTKERVMAKLEEVNSKLKNRIYVELPDGD